MSRNCRLQKKRTLSAEKDGWPKTALISNLIKISIGQIYADDKDTIFRGTIKGGASNRREIQMLPNISYCPISFRKSAKSKTIFLSRWLQHTSLVTRLMTRLSVDMKDPSMVSCPVKSLAFQREAVGSCSNTALAVYLMMQKVKKFLSSVKKCVTFCWITCSSLQPKVKWVERFINGGTF